MTVLNNPLFQPQQAVAAVGFASGSDLQVVSSETGLPVVPKAGEYETVAASQTDQVLGEGEVKGDTLLGLLVVPATTSPGAITIKDGDGGAITVFTGGASSVSNLVPFMIPIGAKSTAGAWKVTTGANVSVLAIGDFT